jgi:hypothetical protein
MACAVIATVKSVAGGRFFSADTASWLFVFAQFSQEGYQRENSYANKGYPQSGHGDVNFDEISTPGCLVAV